MLKALTILVAFQALGELLVLVTGWPVPGPVAGMILLLGTLSWLQRPPDALLRAGNELVRHLALFFLPAGVGIFFLPARFQEVLPALVAAVIVGTLVSLTVTAWVLARLARREKPLV